MNAMVMSYGNSRNSLRVAAGCITDGFGDVLNRARVQRNLTIQQLAHRIGRSAKTVEKLIYGASKPSAATLLIAGHEFGEIAEWALAKWGRTESDALRVLDEIAEKLGETRNGSRRLSPPA